MNNPKILFIVGNTFSLLNAIHIASKNLFKTDKIDIAIFIRDQKMLEVSKKLKKEKIFNGVYKFKYLNNRSTFWKILTFIMPKYSLKYIWGLNNKVIEYRQYDLFIVQSNIYASIFGLINSKAKIIYLDEGISSYTGRRDSIYKRSFFAKLFYKIKMIIGKKKDVVSALLYSRKLYNGDIGRVVEIPPIQSEELKKYIYLFENEKSEPSLKRNVYFLGSPFWGEIAMLENPKVNKINFEEKCKFIVNMFIEEINPKKIIYRPHPIESEFINIYNSKLIIQKSNNSWELYCAKEISNENIIVSIFSTGMITPFLLYKKEPILIFLFRLIGHEFYGAEKLIKDLKLCYKEPHNIYVPETIEDLKNICKLFAS